MSQHQIQYTANYGRHRNLSGNWLYQDASYELSSDCKSRKKQYPRNKCQIEKFRMLNVGQTYIPKVDDLILDVSDIQGTHTDTIKSDAVRNRLIAKQMRECRERRLKTEEQKQTLLQQKPRSIASTPKKSYHLAPIHSIQGDIKLQKQQIAIRNKNHNRTLTEPSESYDHAYDNPINKPTFDKNADQQCNPQLIKIKQIQQNNQKQKRSSVVLGVRFSQQLDSLDQKVKNVNSKIVNTQKKQNNLGTGHSYACNNFSSKQDGSEFRVGPSRLARINPTFLSYGSQYLYNGNNYLASYGKRSIQY